MYIVRWYNRNRFMYSEKAFSSLTEAWSEFSRRIAGMQKNGVCNICTIENQETSGNVHIHIPEMTWWIGGSTPNSWADPASDGVEMMKHMIKYGLFLGEFIPRYFRK